MIINRNIFFSIFTFLLIFSFTSNLRADEVDCSLLAEQEKNNCHQGQAVEKEEENICDEENEACSEKDGSEKNEENTDNKNIEEPSAEEEPEPIEEAVQIEESTNSKTIKWGKPY